MTPSEIEGLATALSSAIKKSGLVATQSVSKTVAARKDVTADAAEKAARKRNINILFSTTTAIKSLGSVADLATTSLRDLTKSAALSVVGLSRFTSALETSSKFPTNKGKLTGHNTRIPKAKPAIDALDLEGAISKAMSTKAEADKHETRALNAQVTKLTKELKTANKKIERANKPKVGSALLPVPTPDDKPKPELNSHEESDQTPKPNNEPNPKPGPNPKPTPGWPSGTNLIPPNPNDGDMPPKKKQLEWLTYPELFKKRILDPIAEDLNAKIKARAHAYSKFELDQAQAEKDRLEAISHNLAQISDFTMKSISIIWHKSIESLDIMFGTLATRGYGTSDSFTSMAVSSARAGMSIQEYTDMMDHSMAVVSRSSSFADFNEKIQTGTDALKKFGIVGPEATKAVSAMATSSTRLGIPQDKLEASILNQVQAFRELQKTTGITVKDFAEMSERLADTASVQTELAALDPAERDNRRAALTQQYAYAKTLSVSERAQNDYTQAILEQRKSTVKTRYNQAGRLMQAGGMIGMGADRIEEMRKLNLNKYKSADEEKRFFDLLGELGTGMEKVQQQGGPGSQYQMDIMREALDSNGLGSSMDAAMAIKLGKESGKTGGNVDMNRNVKTIDQNLAGLFTWIKGWGSNPIGSGLIAITGAITAMAVNLKFGFIQVAKPLGTVIGETAGMIIATAIHGTAHGWSDPNNPVATGPGNPGSTPGNPGANKWAKVIGVGLGAAEIGYGAMSGYSTFSDMNQKEKEEGGPTIETRQKKLGAGIDSVLSTVSGAAMVGAALFPPAAPIMLGISTLSGILSGLGVGGVISKIFIKNESSVDKNTRETNKLTKEMNEARKAQDGADVIDAASLNGLSDAVRRSAIAGSKASAEEIAARSDDPSLTPAQNEARRAKMKADAAIMQRAAETDAKANQSAADLAAGVNPVPLVAPSKSMLQSIKSSELASPTSVSPSRVNSTTVNTLDDDAAAERKAAPQLKLDRKAADEHTTLLEQNNNYMQQQTNIMQQQVDATNELIRTLTVRPSQPGTEFLYQRAMR